MAKTGRTFVFDAEAAFKAASLAVIGLTSAWKYKLQESDRKEIIAEAVAKAWSHRDSYDPARASFQTWVGRITRNTLLDHIRKAKSREDSPAQENDVMTEESPDTLIMEDEGLEAILRAVERLPEAYEYHCPPFGRQAFPGDCRDPGMLPQCSNHPLLPCPQGTARPS